MTLKQELKEYKAAYRWQFKMMKYLRVAMRKTVGKILKLEREIALCKKNKPKKLQK
jgi:hypothetical protein